MSSEPKRRRRRVRYRPGYARPNRGLRLIGGSQTGAADYDLEIQIPENPPITEIEARAVELLLGSALRDLFMPSTEMPRRIRAE